MEGVQHQVDDFVYYNQIITFVHFATLVLYCSLLRCSIFGGHLRVYSHKQRGAIELLYINEIFFASLRWFSIGSEKTIAQWTLFCSPEGNIPRFKSSCYAYLSSDVRNLNFIVNCNYTEKNILNK